MKIDFANECVWYETMHWHSLQVILESMKPCEYHQLRS